jgi:hypothetical protein
VVEAAPSAVLPVQAGVRDLPAAPEILVPAGTRLCVRLDEPLNTRRNRAGDAFRATLDSAVVVDGATLIPAGTRFTGRVTAADPSGRLEGRAVLAMELDSFALQGRAYRIHTNSLERDGAAQRTRNVGFIALLARPGTGTAVAAVTAKEQVGLPAEASVTFSLEAPLRM